MTDMIPPVSCRRCVLYLLAGNIGNKSYSGRFEGDSPRGLGERIQHGLHQRRMKRMRNIEWIGNVEVPFQGLDYRLYRVPLTRDNCLLGTIDGRNRYQHHVRPGENRGHRAGPWQRAHQARSFSRQAQSVFQRKYSRHAGGHILANAVAHHGPRYDAP